MAPPDTNLPPVPQTPAQPGDGADLQRRVQSTPTYADTTHFIQHSFLPTDQERTKEMLHHDLEGLFLGPMPPQDFIDNFTLPREADSALSTNIFKPVHTRLLERKREDVMYAPFTEAANALLTATTAVTTATGADGASRLKPDVVLYRHGSEAPADPSAGDQHLPLGMDFSRVEMVIEFKLAKDPFVDDGTELPYPFEDNGDEKTKIRGQLASYAAVAFGTQYRLHFFMVGIFGSFARLFRWDPAGVVVSKRFEYANTTYLQDFLWRFDGMDNSARGWDPTVTPISDDEASRLVPDAQLTKLKDRENYLSGAKKVKTRHRFFAKMKIPRRSNATTESTFIISCPPKFFNQSPVGRSSRHIYAFDLSLKEIILATQYWRNVGPGIQKEGDIYTILRRRGVSNRALPPFGCGNDVRDISTATQIIKAAQTPPTWVLQTEEIEQLVLYRMSLKVLATPLSEFSSPKVLLSAVLDAMHCHDDAYFDGRILHRAISHNSIMINKRTGRGMLIDWGHSISLDVGNIPPRSRFRTCAWQFLSLNLLRRPNNNHTLEDDRESAIYLLLWVILRYSIFERPEDDSEYMKTISMFDEMDARTPSRVPAAGGSKKGFFLASGELSRVANFTYAGPIADLIQTVKNEIAFRYHIPAIQSAFPQVMAALSERGWLTNHLSSKLDSASWVEPESTDVSIGAKPTGVTVQHILSMKKRKRHADTSFQRAVSFDPQGTYMVPPRYKLSYKSMKLSADFTPRRREPSPSPMGKGGARASEDLSSSDSDEVTSGEGNDRDEEESDASDAEGAS